MKSWQTLSRKVILNHSPYLKVESHEIRLPNGTIIQDWPWIITPDFVTIVLVTPLGEFVLFRQTKYGMDGVGLAPIGGYIEAGELPLVAAKRELLEEAGYESDSWLHMGSYTVDGNRGAGTAHIFLALDGIKAGGDKASVESDDLEEQEMVFLTRDEVARALQDKVFRVLPWAAALALALHYV
ncbi:MAG: NUDIX hydrolase [Anaerolineales bacterium]|nr:MAG: NUDIX hydrolase [Anaerolineales bacterium]